MRGAGESESAKILRVSLVGGASFSTVDLFVFVLTHAYVCRFHGTSISWTSLPSLEVASSCSRLLILGGSLRRLALSVGTTDSGGQSTFSITDNRYTTRVPLLPASLL